MSLKNCLEKLMHHQDLTAEECKAALDEMLTDDPNTLQSAAFLALLRAKKETPEELIGLIASLKEKMQILNFDYPVLDIVGTGGDAAHTINISTGSAILAASCGVKIVKHGNRAVSSLSGSADVLEALGVAIDASPQTIKRCVDELGIGFCFSPNFHPAMLKMRPLRKMLGIPTTFNLLGPLLNPATPTHLILGVMDASLLPLIAGVLGKAGVEKALVVHGCGLDELSCVGSAQAYEVTSENIKEITIDPEALGFPHCEIKDLKGGDATENANILKAILSGEKTGPMADTLMLNAAAACWIYGQSDSIEEALSCVKENLAAGKPMELLNNWIACSHD